MNSKTPATPPDIRPGSPDHLRRRLRRAQIALMTSALRQHPERGFHDLAELWAVRVGIDALRSHATYELLVIMNAFRKAKLTILESHRTTPGLERLRHPSD